MEEVLLYSEEKMEKTLTNLQNEYKSIRAGRANPGVLDRIQVDYYGTPTPINQMAAVSVLEARILQIQPWDASTIRAIEKAIQSSDLGINPQNDGRMIRLAFPQLTEERRRDIVKDISKMAEDSKIAIRNIRRDMIDKFKAMKKSSELSEDDLRSAEKEAQDLTDKYCKKIDAESAKKEKEILEI